MRRIKSIGVFLATALLLICLSGCNNSDKALGKACEMLSLYENTVEETLYVSLEVEDYDGKVGSWKLIMASNGTQILETKYNTVAEQMKAQAMVKEMEAFCKEQATLAKLLLKKYVDETEVSEISANIGKRRYFANYSWYLDIEAARKDGVKLPDNLDSCWVNLTIESSSGTAVQPLEVNMDIENPDGTGQYFTINFNGYEKELSLISYLTEQRDS